MERATEHGEYTLNSLNEMQEEHEIIGDVRGKGLAICLELVKDRETKEPIDGKDFVGRLFRKGIVAVTGGAGIRIFPPLNIEKEILDTSLEILESTIKEVKDELR